MFCTFSFVLNACWMPLIQMHKSPGCKWCLIYKIQYNEEYELKFLWNKYCSLTFNSASAINYIKRTIGSKMFMRLRKRNRNEFKY